MSYRIVLLPWSLGGHPVSNDPDAGPFDDVIPENASISSIEGVADRWSVSPIGRPLKIYSPTMTDIRLLMLQQRLEDEYSFSEEYYRVFTPADV